MEAGESASTDIAVLIVDRSASVRRGLRALFATEPGIFVVAAVHDGQHGMAQLEAASPDVLIMDPRSWNHVSGDAFEEIRKNSPSVAILSFGIFAPDSSATGPARADGVLQKDCEPAELVAMVRRLARAGRGRGAG